MGQCKYSIEAIFKSHTLQDFSYQYNINNGETVRQSKHMIKRDLWNVFISET